MNIYVTGIGMISGIGMNTGEALASIHEGKTGIGRLTLSESAHQDSVSVSEVKRSNAILQRLLGLPEKNVFSRTALLGMMAAGEALKDAGATVEEKKNTVLVSSTSVGGMDLSEGYYRQMKENDRKARLRNIISHDGGDSTGKIAAYHRLSPMSATISTACSSAANAIVFGAGLIRQGLTERVIAGGTDALTLFTIHGFRSLMILDPDLCRPFDDTRSGLNLGEGAGYIVLENEQALMRKGKQPYCRLSGYGNANDAFHQTASSPEGNGPFLAMKKALERSSLSPEQISYINVHGTGTPNNDLSEGRAIERLFQEHIPRFSSTKAFTGHTLGAAGGIEAVLSILSLKHGLVYPNLNFVHPMHDLRITPEKSLSTSFPVCHILSNSFGFGGNCSSLIFSA